ncbi:MAG: 2OG-Fe(II) oxygenase family protein [Pseudomonadota bacterium]
MREIPVIDVSDLDKGSIQLHDDILRAYSGAGFAYIAGHGVPQDLVAGVFEASRRFHALPNADKMAVALDRNHRGFIPIDTSTDRTSTLADVTKPNQSESFMMMRDAGPGDPDVQAGVFLAGANQWPELDGFREAVTAYHDALTAFSRRMVDAMLHAAGAAPDEAAPVFERPTTWLRLLHYPPCASASDDVYGSAPHTDFGAITVLAQDQVGGLQVMTPDGDWIDAPPIPGTFVLNVGDMLHRMTHGALKSTPHRVINRTGRERYSCPFFFDPSAAQTVRTLDSVPKRLRRKTFEPIHFGDFLRSELGASYDQHSDLQAAT